MKLYLRNNGTKENWAEIKVGEDTFKLLLDYPTPEQEQRLQSIIYGVDYLGEDKIVKYAQLSLRYSVKDWRGINDTDDKPVEFKLVKDEMDKDQWWAFVRDADFATAVFMQVSKKIEFNVLDKKKLFTQQSLNTEDTSQESDKITPSKQEDTK